jgi:hypothetical protein
LKRELNERFKETRPEVDPSLTLSQIRNLKRQLIETGVALVHCHFYSKEGVFM